MVMITLYAKQKKRHWCTEQTFGLWEKARVGCFQRTVSKHAYYQGWNRSPAQVGCMRQVFGAGALGRPRGMGWGRRWEGGSGWGTHVNPWLIHINVWQKPLQYCKVISLQLIKTNEKKKKTGCFLSREKIYKKRKKAPWPLLPCSKLTFSSLECYYLSTARKHQSIHDKNEICHAVRKLGIYVFKNSPCNINLAMCEGNTF